MFQGNTLPTLIICALLSMATSTLFAAEPVQGKRFQDWGGNCEATAQGGQLCYLEQILRQGGQPLMNTILGYAPNHTLPTIFFELPPGIHIKSRIRLKVDKNKAIYFSGQCKPQQCTAGFAINRKMLRQLLRGKRATLSYVSTPGRPRIKLPISLMGVTAGLQALRRAR